jgi:hypothetical protein
MKPLDRSDKEHIHKICDDMLKELAQATIILNGANKADYPQHWDLEKSARAVDKIALFIATFPFLHAYADYTAVVRFLIQKLNEYDDPTLTEEN